MVVATPVWRRAKGSGILLTFNTVLAGLGIAPADVRLLRHQARLRTGVTAYRLWHDHRDLFEAWQAVQLARHRVRLAASYWASFVVTPDSRTLFAGLYRVAGHGLVPPGWPQPLGDPSSEPEELYELDPVEADGAYAGRLFIEWGGATRTWVQRADLQDKPIVELSRNAAEPPFPGFSAFIADVSQIPSLPPSWRTALAAARGVYLLACPRTGELYVGSASGGDGFIGRWDQYAADGHGGNVGLKARERSDYQVSILEVAGSLSSVPEIIALEERWKRKLRSRGTGLNQ